MPKDAWKRNYDELVELGAQIGIKIRERDDNHSATKLNPVLKTLLPEYKKKLLALNVLYHRQQAQDYTITDDTFERRDRMIEELDRKYEHLLVCYNQGWSTGTGYKSTDIAPWSGRGGAGGVVGIAAADFMRQEQHDIIEEQDKGLEQLSQGLRKQQKMGLAMQDEIQDHNTFIDDIQEHTSRNDERLQVQTRRIMEVHRKHSCQCTCALWCTVVGLAIAIIVVGAVPFG